MIPAFYIPELVHTPLSNVLGQRHYLQGTRCADFEFRFTRCVDAYGFQAYQDQCQDLYTDLMECVYSTKQRQRCRLMFQEMNKQHVNGKPMVYDDEVPDKYIRTF